MGMANPADVSIDLSQVWEHDAGATMLGTTCRMCIHRRQAPIASFTCEYTLAGRCPGGRAQHRRYRRPRTMLR